MLIYGISKQLLSEGGPELMYADVVSRDACETHILLLPIRVREASMEKKIKRRLRRGVACVIAACTR